jgi:hypothetical protein
MRPLLIVVVVILNAALAAGMQSLAPGQPARTDRLEYEYTGRHPFAPNCPNSIYCYRVAVPVLLNAIPGRPEAKWRGYELAANAAAGATLAIAVYELVPLAILPILSSIIVQSSYGFAFTAYDPYTPDPMVFLISAALLLCWVRNRPLAALIIATGGVFVKETVALVAMSMAIAAVIDRHRPMRSLWLLQGVVALGVLLGFHFVMDRYFGWHTFHAQAGDLKGGGWLAVWWKNNPDLWRKIYILFSPFGFVWLFALVGFRSAAKELRWLALGAVLPMLALVYVQTPERALGNAFFVIVPLAVARLYQSPMLIALIAVVANGLVTAKLGLSSPALPSTAWLLVPALAAFIATFFFRRPAIAIPEAPDAFLEN